MSTTMKKGPRVNPICFVCLKTIQTGEARYRHGLASVHVERDKTVKGT